eukprot:3784929-Prymnesium_polylepis.1
MDSNGDGNLSRFEVWPPPPTLIWHARALIWQPLAASQVLRAFRLNAIVREKLLPLIPMPAAAKNSLTGVDIQQQARRARARV